jgi:hypothetical protein
MLGRLERVPNAVLDKIILGLNWNNAQLLMCTSKKIMKDGSNGFQTLRKIGKARKIQRFWRWCERVSKTSVLVEAFMMSKLANGDAVRAMGWVATCC